MIQLGVATVHIQYRKLNEAELRRLAVTLFEFAESEVRQRLNFDDISVVTEVEEGSLKVRNKIFAGAVAVGAFLSNYGSIREGAVALGNDVFAVGRILVEHIPERLGAGPGDLISTHRSATLTRRIDKIVREVERGELDGEEAVRRLVRLLEDQDQVVKPSLVEFLKREVSGITRGNERASRKSAPYEKVSTLATEEFTSRQEEPEVPRLPPPVISDRPRRIRVEREQGKLRVIEE